MIDLERPIPLALSRVRAWADDADAELVWASAAAPRWALGGDGRPEVSLLLYRHGDQGEVEGGQANATLTLGITADEQAAVVQATGRPSYRPLEWQSGTIELRLLPGLATTAPTSLSADRALLTYSLDAAMAQRLHSAWQAGLPQGHATALGTTLSRRTAASRSRRTTATEQSRTDLRIATSMSNAVEVPLTLSADLRLPEAGQHQITIVSL